MWSSADAYVKDVAPYSVVVGCPARHVRDRKVTEVKTNYLETN